MTESFSLGPLASGSTVSAILDKPAKATAVYAFAHGAGAGMEHAFMAQAAEGLASRGIATLRFNFPYMEAGGKRVDAPVIAHATIRAAVTEAARLMPGVPIFAGGKSFGGRMTSQAQAAGHIPQAKGLVFFGFPLHNAGKPAIERAKHLADVSVPMLFLQGTRDELAEWTLIEQVTGGLGEKTTLHRVEHADHAFHVLKRTGRNDAEVMEELLETAAAWMIGPRPSPG